MDVRLDQRVRKPSSPSGLSRAESKAGYTLLEILVALVVLIIGVLGYMALQFQSVNGRVFARSMNTASTAGLATLEEMRTIDFDQLQGSGTLYRSRWDGTEAAEADYESGDAYKIEWQVGEFTGIATNPNVRLRELKTVYAVVRWKEKGVEHSMTLTTFERGFKTGDTT